MDRSNHLYLPATSCIKNNNKISFEVHIAMKMENIAGKIHNVKFYCLDLHLSFNFFLSDNM